VRLTSQHTTERSANTTGDGGNRRFFRPSASGAYASCCHRHGKNLGGPATRHHATLLRDPVCEVTKMHGVNHWPTFIIEERRQLLGRRQHCFAVESMPIPDVLHMAGAATSDQAQLVADTRSLAIANVQEPSPASEGLSCASDPDAFFSTPPTREAARKHSRLFCAMAWLIIAGGRPLSMLCWHPRIQLWVHRGLNHHTPGSQQADFIWPHRRIAVGTRGCHLPQHRNLPGCVLVVTTLFKAVPTILAHRPLFLVKAPRGHPQAGQQQPWFLALRAPPRLSGP